MATQTHAGEHAFPYCLIVKKGPGGSREHEHRDGRCPCPLKDRAAATVCMHKHGILEETEVTGASPTLTDDWTAPL